ncbi:40-residue YVTN family beta-propeller repeat-containing protein [Modicisalibacter muralis]|uniref:40-residue YVTN family beta-propeller repeat-containing protein n=1 Tax=Modicisalibacter muralis TaxID=119000 RepID=A0A1G9M8T2_9GAMM|nr:cytochrome D1 domain-containing protein [Halomonas muralis]SDL70692.1 40-residue YVTN family beta-propeller repeat-containing protein [Halomonas muralis]
MTLISHLPTRRPLRLARICCAVALACNLGIASAAELQEPFPAPIYVTLQTSNAVENMPIGQTWDGLASAHFNAVGPDGNLMLVSSKDLPEVYLLDVHSGEKLATFEIGPTPQGVAIGPNGRWGLAVSAGSGVVAVIDMKAQKLVKSIAVGKVPHNARFTADGKLAYVTLQGGGGVAVVDMQTLTKVDEFPVPGIKGPHNLDLSADGNTLWIRDLVGKVAAVDLATGKELAVIPVGLGHAGIDVVPGGQYVFTGAIADHVVDVIDPDTFKVIKRIDVGQGPHGVRASRDGRWVYAAVTGTDKVAVIDTRTLEVVKQVPVDGELPFWLSVVGND